MAYTGTGTETDPYCVSNLTDFIECVKKTGSYVKVIADIDAAEDASYTGELTKYIEMSCKQVYADEPKQIKGVTVYSNYFINISNTGGTRIENLSFIDCEHKRTANTTESIHANYGTNVFKNCRFSMKIVGQYGLFSSTYLTFSGCAGNLTYTAVTSPSGFSGSSFENCNFTVDGAVWISTVNLFSGAVKKSGFIFTNPVLNISSSMKFYVYSSTNEYCYVVLIHPEMTGTNADAVLSQKGTKSLTSLIALPDSPDSLTVEKNNGLTEITSEQLKDKEYLAGIGFFP